VAGGHFNIAVTTAVFIVEYRNWRKNWKIALVIMLCGVAGGFFGCCMKGVFDGWDTLVELKPSRGGVYTDLYHVYLEEALFTFLFISVIIHTKYENVAPSKDGVLNTLTIALTLFGLVCMASADTGACFNPTIGITFTIMEYAKDLQLGESLSHYIVAYFFGPITGAILAALWLITAGFWVSPVFHEHV